MRPGPVGAECCSAARSGRWPGPRTGRISHWTAVIAITVAVGAFPWIAAAQTVQAVRLRWDAYPAGAGAQVEAGSQAPSNAFTVLERRPVAGSIRRERDPQLSSEHLVIVAADAQGQEVYRSTIRDPRILRAEFPGPTGELRGEVFHHASTELQLVLPDDPAITEVRIYHPRWTGTAFSLEPLGVARLR